MRGGQFVTLSARQKGNARDCRRHGALQDAHGTFRHLGHAGLPRAAFAGDHHRGFEHRALERHAVDVERVEHGIQRPFGDLFTALDGVIAVHQHFGFNDGHEARFLANRGVARERVGIGGDTRGAGNFGADGYHRSPLGEFCAELGVFGAALWQIVEAFGDQFAGTQRKVFRARIDLDAGQYAVFVQEINERGAVGGFLPQRFVIQNHAADGVADALGGEQHVAIGAAIFFGVFNLDAVETLADGAGTLVGGEDAAAGSDHGASDLI